MSPNLQRILCVDDESDILEIAEFALENVGGYTVEVCKTGVDACDHARAFQPDVILLDAMMPEMDGAATLQELRGDPDLASIPVIFMTAKVQPKEIQQYLQLGAIAVIGKPFDPLALAEDVEAAWRKHRDGQ